MTERLQTDELIEIKQIASIGDQQYPAFELRHTLEHLREHGHSEWCNRIETELDLNKYLNDGFLPSHIALESLNRVMADHFEVGLGVEIAKRYRTADFQMLGAALNHAPSLYEALNIALAYYELIGSFTDLTIIQNESNFTTRLVNVSGLSNELVHFLFELTISGMSSIGQSIAGRPIHAKSLKFEMALNDAQKAFFEKEFGCTVTDEASFNEWALDVNELKTDIRYEPLAKEDLERSIEDLNTLMQALKDEFALVDRFDRLVRANENEFLNSKELAQRLHMSERTFRRKLNRIGLNYNALMGKIRCQIAIAMLQSGAHTNESIAFDLGFSDAANFCNAFKKWTGHTPNFYRP